MQFWSHCYTVVSYQVLFRLSVYKIPAVYLSGAKNVCFCTIRDFGSPTIVLFSENNVCTWPLRIRFSIVIRCLWVIERCPSELFKDCHRQTPKPVAWTHRLAITPQPKGAIFSHRKRWVVSTGLKHHTIMWKHRLQRLKAFFIHSMQFCGPWVTHKKWHSNAFRSSF